MLSQEEIEELSRSRTELVELNSKIEVLSKMVQSSPEAAGKQEQDIERMRVSIQQKKELLSALAFYISKRVELNFSRLKMNRVAISLYDVVKTTGEVKEYSALPMRAATTFACPAPSESGPDWRLRS